jgi:hypothetical protein
MTHVNYTKLANNTIKGGNVAHVGQLYFDQDLLEQVEKMPPYNTNQQFWFKNNQDALMGASSAGGSDPVLEYVVIGGKLENGIFAWINYGIDSKTNQRVFSAAECTADGCKEGKGLMDIFSGFMPKGMGFGNNPGAPPSSASGFSGLEGLLPAGWSFPTALPSGFDSLIPKGFESFFPKGPSSPAPKSTSSIP